MYCSVAAKAEVAKEESVLFPLLVRFDVAAAAVWLSAVAAAEAFVATVEAFVATVEGFVPCVKDVPVATVLFSLVAVVGVVVFSFAIGGDNDGDDGKSWRR